MKTIKFFAVALAAITMSLSACKKDEATPATNKVSGASLLTGKDWRITALTVASPGGTIDVFSTYAACKKDDLREYLANGTIVNKAGATKCDPSDPDTEPGGFWALIDNDTKLRIIDGDTNIIDIIELSANTLRGKAVVNDNGSTFTTNFTFVKN
jgi:hypothetical protein